MRQKQREMSQKIWLQTSTPTVHQIPIPAVSDITTSESDIATVDTALSGVEEFQEKESVLMEKSKSFINQIRPDSNICLEDDKEDDTDDDEDGSDQPEIEGPDIWCIHTVEDTFNFFGDSPFLVYYSALLSLAKTNVPLTCRSKGYGTEISVCRQVVGSALSTAELENFQNLILLYQESFNNQSGRWSANPKKADKQYLYIPEIIRKILKMRLDNGVGMNQPVVLDMNDPRRISAVPAAIPPLPTEVIVAKQKSRLKLQ
ncbi:hypothetical protein CHS0354_037480 [Potamilus streckersoni]|uniref:Uncharacterized protein n=1 Tax=Potamilus streckersoni TaxID=2493646 RepID=A0AAE0RPB4_9BIVA|nr:hypothetical protein CHS0354_037480 [Potamilus streckersoni]